jgi:hypothetical protein
MAAFDTLLQTVVITGFALWSWTKFKGQTMRETFEDIKELFNKFKNE